MSAVIHEGMPAAQAAAVQDDDEINLLEYWQILRERQWLIAGIAAAVVAVALVLTLLATPIFRASSTLQIERDTIKVVDVGGLQPTESPMDRDFYQTQYELLQSRTLARRVVQDLNLVAHAEFGKTVEAVDEDIEARGKASDLTKQEARERAVSEALVEGLTIEPIRNSRLVRVNFDSPDPALAARVANAYADGFIASNLERRFEASSYAREYLEERLADLKAKLEDTEKELVSFAADEEIISVGDDQPSLSAQNLSQLNASLATAQDARIRAEAAWRQASAGNGMGLPQVVASPLIQKLREARALLAAEYQEKLRTYKPDYPDMQRLSGQIAESDRQIAAEVAHIRDAVRSEFLAAQQQETLLESRLRGLKGDVLDLQGRSIQYNILKREAETNRQLYDGLLQRYKEISVAGNVGTNNVSVVDRAEVPQKKHSPRLSLNLAVALLLGLFAGVLAAFLRHHLDRSIHTPKALEKVAGLPVLGAIPRLAEGTTPAMASTDLRSPFSESYRSVRTALQFATTHGLPSSLLVTSSGPGEGKTTTALELARNIAQLGKRVLLVDADLRNPSMHRRLSLDNARGLSTVLSGAAGADEVIQPAGEPNLSVITSGPLPPNPPELLAGDHLVAMLEQLRARYDVLVLDGPPILGLADAPMLASRVESTLLIAAADHTRSDALLVGLQRLHATHANLVGTLLTRFDLHGKGESYGYGGYAYGGDAN